MNESLFIEFIKTIWPVLNLYITEKTEPKKRTYLHKTMLRRVYSADQTRGRKKKVSAMCEKCRKDHVSTALKNSKGKVRFAKIRK